MRRLVRAVYRGAMSAPLLATRVHWWNHDYRISVGGHPLLYWHPSAWGTGGAMVLDGRNYHVRSTVTGSRYLLTDETGAVVAAAERVGRKQWMVLADGQCYHFRRARSYREEQRVADDGAPAGAVLRTSQLRRDAIADLPGLPLLTQAFVFLVVLSAWDSSTDLMLLFAVALMPMWSTAAGLAPFG